MTGGTTRGLEAATIIASGVIEVHTRDTAENLERVLMGLTRRR